MNLLKKNQRLLFGIILGAFILIMVGVIAYEKHITAQYKYFISQVSHFVIPPVSVNDMMYEIKDGKVLKNGIPVGHSEAILPLRITYYIILNRLNPIFAIEGTDPSLFHKSVENLITSLEEYISFFTTSEGAALWESLYPITFLKALEVLELKRKEMIARPSPETIEIYNTLLTNTLNDYKNDVKKINNFFIYNNSFKYKTEPVQRFYFLSGFATARSFTNFFFLLQENADMQEEKIKRRKLCIKGRISQCRDLKIALHYEYSKDNNPKELPSATLQHAKNIRKILHDYYQSNIFTGPLFILPSSRCFEEGPFYSDIIWDTTKNNRKTPQMLFLNDVYFYDITNADSPYLKMFQGQLDYLYQPITNMYLCPDIGKSFVDSLTMYGIISILKQNPIFQEKSYTSYSTEELADIERQIISKDTVSLSDIEHFIFLLSEFLTKNETTTPNGFTHDDIIHMEKILLIFKNKSYSFDGLINAIIDQNMIIKELKRITPEMSLESIMVSRSYPLITFLVFNNSFYSTAQEAKFISFEKIAKSNFNLVSSKELVDIFFSPEIFISKMREGRFIKEKLLY